MESVKYFLVLEKRLGDYNIIDINKLDICKNYIGSDISSIDFFTCSYKEEEIKKSIERSNTARPGYLEGNLKIISDKKHNLKILTKENLILIQEFQNNDIEPNRELKNKLYGLYKKIVENTFENKNFIDGMLDRFKETLNKGNKKEIFKIIEELPYAKSRIIYLSLSEELKN